MINNNLHNYVYSPFIQGAENIKIALKKESKVSNLSLAERIGRFVLGILEMIPVINYLVAAVDKHLIFKEKICTIVPHNEKNQFKAGETVRHQTIPEIETIKIKKHEPALSGEENPIEISIEESIQSSVDESSQSREEEETVMDEVIQFHDEEPIQTIGEEASQSRIEVPIRYRELKSDSDSDSEDASPSCQTVVLNNAWKIGKLIGGLILLAGTGYLISKVWPWGNSVEVTPAGLNTPPISPLKPVGVYNPPTFSPYNSTSVEPVTIEPNIALVDRPQNGHICLLTAYTSDNSERLEMSKKVADNQRDYSNKKGYSYLEYAHNNLANEIDPMTGKTTKLEPYWLKILDVNKILNDQETELTEKPEWIVWMDDDAVITNKAINMEDVIEHYTKDRVDELNFFVTTDSVSHIHGIPLNSAVLFIKNNDWSRNFFKKVWEMRNTQVLGRSYTYGNCPDQSCFHEQQAISDLLTKHEGYAKNAQIIPQRDPKYPIGINTFVRENHIDLNRNNLFLDFSNDLEASKGKAGDFIQQCTGLSTHAYRFDSQGNQEWGAKNLRLECVNKLSNIPEPQTWEEFMSNRK